MMRWAGRVAGAAAALLAAFGIGGALSAMSRLPDLQPWHHLVTTLEPDASEISESFALERYLQHEDAVFHEAEQLVDAVVSAHADPVVPNRYVAASRSAPLRLGTNFNRTQIGMPTGVRGGALLLHGLTDSPYSMRAMAARLQGAGYYTLSLRLQGHGTVPGGLVGVAWEDWAAAVRMGMRHLRRQVGESHPLVIVGYSNGGALAVHYALESLDDARLPAPAKLVLVSPMIGVSAMARLARAISVLGPVPFFEKARWLDVFPEYNPFKYNSFAANAGLQTGRVTADIQRRLSHAAAAGTLARFPPTLAFQSVVDTTVSTPAVVNNLFNRLPAGGHELVLFDLNRASGVDAFTRPGAVLPRLSGRARPFSATLVTNEAPGTFSVAAMRVSAGSTHVVVEPLAVEWPRDMYSLSHVSLPFPEDDPVYGGASSSRQNGGLALGRLAPRGEKDALIVPIDTLMRVTWNPFFSYMARRMEQWVATERPQP
jgi:alpha-beta hydrolase superfamily lysophospholipase